MLDDYENSALDVLPDYTANTFSKQAAAISLISFENEEPCLLPPLDSA